MTHFEQLIFVAGFCFAMAGCSFAFGFFVAYFGLM